MDKQSKVILLGLVVALVIISASFVEYAVSDLNPQSSDSAKDLAIKNNTDISVLGLKKSYKSNTNR